MIIARIDNEISTRTPYRRGRSFKGALRYLLQGSRDAPNPDRVIHAETVNIWSDLDGAAHDMAATWENRFRLMAAAGLAPRNGADNRAPVYHAVVSWTADEDPPPPAEMAETAKQLLHLLGLGEHEAVLVVHGDTQNPHIHIIVNTVHPITGRTAPLRFDKRIMQGFAARYEEMRGRVVCDGRFRPDARRAFNAATGQPVSKRRDSRPRWARTNEPARAAARAALPSVILDTLTRHNATFSPADLAQAVTAATVSASEFSALMAAVIASPQLVRLEDADGKTRYTTIIQQAADRRIAANAAALAGLIDHSVTTAARTAALSRFAASDQQGPRDALAHLLDERGLSIVVGYAGAGKSTLLTSAAEAWRSSGFTLRGLALAGRTAEALEADTGMTSGTIAAFLMGLDSGTISLCKTDILVVDEAGMVASRQLDQILEAARKAGAKVVLVGDPEQLQAIEAGGPFRYIVEHYEHARLSTVWRQRHDWMRTATRDLAEARTQAALGAYDAAGMVQGHGSKDAAITAMLDMWLANREGGRSQLILTATNADAAAINAAARDRLHALGALGSETVLDIEDTRLAVAVRDRIVFRRNDRTLGVKNGTTGTVLEVTGRSLSVLLDARPPRVVQVDTAHYPHLAHGYAVTIHKAQGSTVDRAYVLAAPNMDRHSAYVALSRHRDRVSLHWSRDVFNDRQDVTRCLSRRRVKDVTLDYRQRITESVRVLMKEARERSSARGDIDSWTRLYAAQRTEAATVFQMSRVRRAFWMAANADRLLAHRALSLEKLHERERAAFAMHLKTAPTTTLQAVSAGRKKSRKPTPETVLGLTRPAASSMRASPRRPRVSSP